MAERQVNLRVAIAGEKEYKAAISEMNQGNKVLASEMKKLQAEFEGNTQSMEYFTQRGEILEKQLLQQQDKTAKLREALKHAANTYGESSETTQKWQVSLNEAEAAEFRLQHAIEENNKALQGQDEEMLGLGDTVEKLADKLGIRIPDGAKEALNGMQGLSTGTVAAMAAAAAAIAAVVEVVRKLGQLTLEVAAQVDDYITQSSITGVPTEILQAWDYAAPLIDVDAETITDSMAKIIRSMNDARDGSGTAAEAFQALGISVTDADGNLRNAQEVFFEVIDALGQVTNETERTALAQELLGKNAQELNPLILAGSGALSEFAEEAERVGYILTEDQIKVLGETDDAYQRLQLTIEANRKQMAADFAPAAKAAMELFADVVTKAGQALKDSGLIKNLASIIESIIEIIRTTGEFIQSIPGIDTAIKAVNAALTTVAYTFAAISDAMKVIVGLMPTMWGSGMLKEGLGLGYSSGNANSVQRLTMSRQGTLDQYDSFYAQYGHNAGGTDYWRGGLTWVGEAGPELVNLPEGSQIMNAQESKDSAWGTVIIQSVNIDAKNVKEFNDIIRMVMEVPMLVQKR